MLNHSPSPGRKLAAALVGVVVLAAIGLWYSMGRTDSDLVVAERALAEGDLPTAYKHLQLAAPHAPPTANLPGKLAELAIQQGLLAEAESWISRLPVDGPGRVRLRLTAAGKGMELADASRVESLLQAILREDARQFAARQMLARLYLLTRRQSDLRRQVAAMDRLSERGPDADLLLLYCIGTRTRWLDAEPREWLERALRLDPANGAVRAALAHLLIQSDEREEARGLLSDSAAVGGADVWRVSLMRIEDLLESGKSEQAAQIIGGLDPAAHADARYWIALGQLAFDQNDLKSARSSFEAAIQLDPFEPEAFYRLARLTLRQGGEHSELFQRAHLLSRLTLAAKRALEKAQERQEALQETASVVEQLGFARLTLLFYTSLTADYPDLASARTKVAEWQTDPTARQPLPEPAGSVVGANVAPIRPAIRRAPLPKEPDQDTKRLAQQAPQFWDIAESVGLKFEYRRAPTRPKKPLMMNVVGGGVAVLDFDGDGWPDLFFSQGTPVPVPDKPDDRIGRLFRNIRGTAYEEVTPSAKITDFGFGQGCAVADYDNDGFADLFVCHYGAIRLYRNNGDGTFHDATASSGLADPQWSSSAAFGDFDRDGDLDLFVVHYVTLTWPDERCCLPVDFPRSHNAVWENRGDGTFVERTEHAGILVTDSLINRPRDGDPARFVPAKGGVPAKGYGLAVVVEDLDNDGWLDVYVANDMTPNFLFRNLGRPVGTGRSPFSFSETGVVAGAAVNDKGEVEASMGLACADVDGNGQFDLFVTTFQEETNTLHRNHGDFSFSDDTARLGLLDLNPPKMGWGCQFLDTRGRGQLDVFIVNSHLQFDRPQTPSFFSNQGERFAEMKLTSPYFHAERAGRALATLDWNRDFRPDLVATYLKGNVSLINNESAVGNRFAVELVGRTGNRDGESARVIVQVGNKRRVYRVSRGGGFLVANEKHIPIGLGGALEARWEVAWPSGLRQECGVCRAGTRYLVIEGSPPIRLPDL